MSREEENAGRYMKAVSENDNADIYAAQDEVNDDRLIEEYLKLADEAAPDLWERIEEGLDKGHEQNTGAQRNSTASRNYVVTDAHHKKNDRSIDRHGRNSAYDRQRFITVFAGVAAAVIVCALVLTGLVRSGLLTNRNSGSMDNSASGESFADKSYDESTGSESVTDASEESFDFAETSESDVSESATEPMTESATEDADDSVYSDSSAYAGSDETSDFAQTDAASDMANGIDEESVLPDNAKADSAEVVRIKITLADWEIGTGDEESTVYRCVVGEIEDNSFGIEAGQSITVTCGDTDAANDAEQSGESLDGYLTGYNSELGAWRFTDK